MFLSYILSRLTRTRAYAWRPSIDLSDRHIACALIPHGQH